MENREIVQKLKKEMKQLKEQANNFGNITYKAGYVEAIRTLEDYLFVLEKEGLD
jgi:hypothetical protein